MPAPARVGIAAVAADGVCSPSEVGIASGAAWGRPVEAVLSKISDEPIAAASLGQVHRLHLLFYYRSACVQLQLLPRPLESVF